MRYDPYGRPRSQADLQQLAHAYRKLEADRDSLVEALQHQQALLERQSRQISHLEQALAQARQQLAAVQDSPVERQRLEQMAQELQTARQRSSDLEASSAQAQARIAELESNLIQAQREADKRAEDESTWRERYARLQADLENSKKRQERRFAQQAAQDRERILLDMLPVADHLELGLEHLRNSGDGQANPLMQSYLDNLESTRRAFLDALQRHGIQRMEAQEEVFDPELHEAIGQVASSNTPEGHVAHVVQAGYRDGERLLRPARVLVSSGPADQALG